MAEPPERVEHWRMIWTEQDLYLFNEGRHFHLFEKMGAHWRGGHDSEAEFSVWAPSAEKVGVVGDFND